MMRLRHYAANDRIPTVSRSHGCGAAFNAGYIASRSLREKH